MINVCVIGLGYVGLTLGLHAARNGYKVFGIETNDKTFESINNGKCHFHEPGIDELLDALKNKNFFPSKKIPDEIKIDVFIVSVGTPLSESQKKEPNIDILNNAMLTIKDHINETNLLILRSTIPVGSSRRIEQTFLGDLDLESLNISFCPERTAEGKALSELRSLPQIISGNNHNAITKARAFFEPLTDEIVETNSLEEAELIKLLNNTYRDACFGIANTFNEIAQNFKVDGRSAIEKANFNYPRSSIPYPGFVAGPCLEKDAYILASNIKSKRLKDYLFSIRDANEYLEDHLANSIKNIINQNNFDKILISGLAFKGIPQTNDMRGSSSIKILKKLEEYKDKIVVHDFMNTEEEIKDIMPFNISIMNTLFDTNINFFNLIVIMNNNPDYKSIKMREFISRQINSGSKILDVWDVMGLEGQKTISNFFIKSEE